MKYADGLFTKCSYFETYSKKGHCPFSCVCYDEDCIFSLKQYKEAYDTLSVDYKELHDEYWKLENNENELEDLKHDFNCLEEQFDELDNDFKNMINWIKECVLDKISEEDLNYLNLDDILVEELKRSRNEIKNSM